MRTMIETDLDFYLSGLGDKDGRLVATDSKISMQTSSGYDEWKLVSRGD